MIELSAYINGLVQERRNSRAIAMELCLSCTDPSICIVELSTHMHEWIMIIYVWVNYSHIYMSELSTYMHKWISWYHWFISLTPERCGGNFKNVIFKPISMVNIRHVSCQNICPWMPQDFFDDEATLVQVMTWCCLTKSYYVDSFWQSCYMMSPRTNELYNGVWPLHYQASHHQHVMGQYQIKEWKLHF